METLLLKNTALDGTPLTATYAPKQGMGLISYKKGEIEVLDQSTRKLFEERSAGLGPLIGPHFHRRKPEVIPAVPEAEKFPHIAAIKAAGGTDPFTHGVGRYAPWHVEASESEFHATLKGSDEWNGVPLSQLEGQDFTLTFSAKLLPDGLHYTLSVVSEADSIIGIHYYYHLPSSTGKIVSQVQPEYIVNNTLTPIPDSWDYDDQRILTYPLDQDTDFTFHPYPDPLKGKILLDTGDYKLETTYSSDSQENAWQLWHPKGASFVCVEPVSAQDPRHANLTVSSIKIQLQIL